MVVGARYVYDGLPCRWIDCVPRCSYQFLSRWHPIQTRVPFAATGLGTIEEAGRSANAATDTRLTYLLLLSYQIR